MHPRQHSRKIFDDPPALALHDNGVIARQVEEPERARIVESRHENIMGTC